MVDGTTDLLWNILYHDENKSFDNEKFLCYKIYNMKDNYTTREICRGLDIPERQLIHWAEKGLVEPLVDANGFASRRHYSRDNVFEIAIIKALWGKVSNKTIKTTLMWLSILKKNPEEAEYLVIVGQDVEPVKLEAIKERLPLERDFDFVETLKNSELIIILNVKKIHEGVLNFLT
jgi:DNA-binding transcriptional MerR regulator